MTWCWYNEGSSFHGGYASRLDAAKAALDDESQHALVGTESDPMERIRTLLDVRSIAESLSEEMNVDGCSVRYDEGAQSALERWAMDHLGFDARVVCLDGLPITPCERALWESER